MTSKCTCPSYYAVEDANLTDFCSVHGLPEFRAKQVDQSDVERAVREFAAYLRTQFAELFVEDEFTKLAERWLAERRAKEER